MLATRVVRKRRNSGRDGAVRVERLKVIVNRSLVLPLLVTVAVFGVVGCSAGRSAGRAGDPTYFIHAGQRYFAPE
jgi:hypothetical protein